MHLTLVVSDCPAVGEGVDPVDAPPLPALSTLLGRARREFIGGGWHGELTRRHAPVPTAGLAPGVIASAALPDVRARHACFATPVHLLATPDHLRLPANGLLVLRADDGAALAADFARVFQGSGLALHPGWGRFVLTGLPGGEGSGDPAASLGSRLEAGSRVDATWRRLASEIELWLHEHPVNQARAARGRLPVNALWLWGGGPLPPQWPLATPDAAADADAVFHGEDPFVAGLAALNRCVMQPVPDAPGQILASGRPRTVVQFSLSTQSSSQPRTLAALDADWFAPILGSLRAGELDSIDVLLDSCSARLTRAGLARFWRRQRPWWEYLRR